MSMACRGAQEVVVGGPVGALVTCTDAVGREAKGMVAIREGSLVVTAPPGGSISFTIDQLDDAEGYGEAVVFGLEMLRRQAESRGRHVRRPGKRQQWWRAGGGS